MPTLDVVTNYSDGTILTQAQLNAAFESIESFVNLVKLDDENIQSGSINTALIAADAISSEKIQASAVTLAKLATEVVNKLVPAGTIHAYGGQAVIPAGYFLCDGQAISRTVFSALFGAIGTNYGNGDGATTFNVPDFRGKFLRGRDGGALVDPDAASRIASGLGGATADNVGSYQGYETALPVATTFNFAGTTSGQSQNHSHTITTTNFAGNGGNGKVAGSSGNTGDLTAGVTSGANVDHTHTYSGTITNGGSETRPKNVYVNYIIKS